MTKYKKIRDVNGRYNYHMTLENGNEFYVSGDVGDYIKSLENQLLLHDVSQQRELLSAFQKNWNKYDDVTKIRNKDIDAHIKGNL